MRRAGALLLLAAGGACGARGGLHVPGWGYEIRNWTEQCVATPEMRQRGDVRAAWAALPDGQPPAGGWPVLFSFVTDTYTSAKCNTTGQRGKGFHPFVTPQGAMAECFPDGLYDQHSCTIDDESGMLWYMRIKQLLIANGVAIVVVNPVELNGWQFNRQSNWTVWEQGTDRLLLPEMVRRMRAGDFGPLDPDRVVFRGWSGGAAMVSWVVQLLASGQLSGVTMRGGVFLSGGSYNGYATPPYAHGVCRNCNASRDCGGWTAPGGCSTRPGTWPPGTAAPCCQYCSPDYAEEWYARHPEAWPSHPPAFLAQLGNFDVNADLCAARNYHTTLLAHGVRSELVVPSDPGLETCFCVGDARDPAAKGSPYARTNCTTDFHHFNTTPGPVFCLAHALAFADMVEPMVNFVLDSVQ
eukprot:TRINITY_DN2202_c0_g3_i1.p1 TRINITY_DN2202_c0_g3~~TRINITY_DN2202_c0_g3_i1.p1  ORF type:complete len:438 (+),score=130.86 TRINITY_DN2202_c0_g3_i1:87-1316(+)